VRLISSGFWRRIVCQRDVDVSMESAASILTVEYGGGAFLRKVGTYDRNYTKSQTGRQLCLCSSLTAQCLLSLSLSSEFGSQTVERVTKLVRPTREIGSNNWVRIFIFE
jgi:hypothetical protein